MLSVEIYGYDGRQFRPFVVRGLQYSTHFSSLGSGFGFCRFMLDRKVGFDYGDIGYYYPVVVRRGPYGIRHYGEIRQIQESSADRDVIEITSIGYSGLLEDEPYNRIFVDPRPGMWEGEEDEEGSLRPDRFDYLLRAPIAEEPGIYIRTRKGTDYDADDYMALRYTMPFEQTIKRFRAHYHFAAWSAVPLKTELRDDAGSVLWSIDAPAGVDKDVEAEIDVTVGGAAWIELRLYVTEAGEVTADNDTQYVELSNLRVQSLAGQVVTAKDVAEEMVVVLAQSGLGLSPSTVLLEDPGVALLNAYFDDDRNFKQVLDWMCQFGDSQGRPVAWGVSLDDEKRLFLKSYALDRIDYVVARGDLQEARVSGDASKSYQKVYGVYQDASGVQQRTADKVDQDRIDLQGGRFRRRAIPLRGVSDADQIDKALALSLQESSPPGRSSSFQVTGPIYSRAGRRVPFEDVACEGGLVQIKEWRAVEAEAPGSSDFRDQYTTFLLVKTVYDDERKTLQLTPAGALEEFERYMAQLAEMAEVPSVV